MMQPSDRIPRFPRRGLALIIVAGVLGVMTVLATGFVTLARLERRASERRVHATRALLLARSGIEDALARLAAGQDALASPSRYEGEDWKADGPDAFDSTQEIFQPGIPNTADCPLRMALRPSFPVTSSTVPRLLDVDGRRRGFSGLLSGDATAWGNTYALKVEDESGKININGGFLDGGNRDAAFGDLIPDFRDPDVRDPLNPKDMGRGWNAQLVRILDILGSQPEVGITALGTSVLANRPMGGYPSLEALQKAISATTDLSPYLTVRSWVDVKVIHPNGYPTQVTSFPDSMNAIKKNRLPLAMEENGRPPVNLNTTAKPVLCSLLQGLRGTTWQVVKAGRSYQISPTMANAIAGRILTRRATSPFESWSDFSAFCDTLVVPGVIAGMNPPNSAYGGGNLCGADLLKANFDPNSCLNKNLPDQLLWRWIDKSDLSIWSTEGSLGPTGSFRVSALGRVMDSKGNHLASCSLSVMLEGFRILRQTTQQDFVAGRSLDSHLSLSSGEAFGHRTTGSTSTWRSPAWGADKGLAATTYPCAPMALPSPLDGCIGLATVEEPKTDPTMGSLLFLHHLDDGLEADVGTPKTRLGGVWDAALQTTSTIDLWPAPPVEPSVFLPDGLHSQRGRSPGFQAQGNFPVSYALGDTPSNHGVISYWVKQTSGQDPNSPTIGGSAQFNCVRNVAFGRTHTLQIGAGEWAVGAWGLHLESWEGTELNHELVCTTSYAASMQALKPDLRWRLVTAWFDTDETDVFHEMGLDTRGVLPFGPLIKKFYGSAFAVTDNQDLLASGVAFVLGADPNSSFPGEANQVIDEVAIYDFGDDGSAMDVKIETFNDNRYADGRYYKGDDARFLSGVLEPDPRCSARLLSARWTEYLPRENRQEILAQFGTTLSAQGTPRLIDTRLTKSAMELELLDRNGTLAGLALQKLSPGESIDRTLDAFRYRITFKPNPLHPVTGLPDPNQPVLETPFLDDITFTWQAMTGPRILGWGG